MSVRMISTRYTHAKDEVLQIFHVGCRIVAVFSRCGDFHDLTLHLFLKVDEKLSLVVAEIHDVHILSTVDRWIIGSANEVVKGYVEVVREGDEQRGGWFSFTFFIAIVGDTGKSNGGVDILLGYVLSLLEISQAFCKGHDATS